MTEDNRSNEQPKPALVIGFVIKESGKDAVVSAVEWKASPDGRPTRADLMSSFEAFLTEWFHYPCQSHQDGSVGNLGDLIGEAVFMLPGLKGGTGHKVAFEKHGEYYPVDTVEFDELIRGDVDGEYDDEGTDMVLLTGPGD